MHKTHRGRYCFVFVMFNGKGEEKSMKRIITIIVFIGMLCSAGIASADIYPIQDVTIVQSGYIWTAEMVWPYSQENFEGLPDLLAFYQIGNIINKGLIQFDLSSLSGPVSKAELNISHTMKPAPGAIFGLYQINGEWDADVVTWDTAPPVEGTPFSTMTITDGNWGVLRTFDVTVMVNAWLSGTPNYGMMLSRVDQENPGTFFMASESGSGPYLSLISSQVPIPSSVFLLLPGLIGLASVKRREKR